MSNYNFEDTYKNLWWTIRYYGFEPDDHKIKGLLDHVYDEAYTQGQQDIDEDELDEWYDRGYQAARDLDEGEIEDRGFYLGVEEAKDYVSSVLRRSGLTTDQKLEILQGYADT